jgi:glycosyltransferase involved in cell wall biosynthesis
MSNELVSVLIPALNAARTIRETIQSACRQTYAELEIIVVDDGSADETAEIVREMGRADPRICLVQQQNAGVAAARNKALALARGALIAPLDADDIWHCDKIARQARRLDGVNAHAGVIYCWSADIDAASRVVARRLDLDRYEGDVYAPLVVTNFLSNASVPLIRRKFLDEVGGWDASLHLNDAQGCEDWHLYLRLAERTHFLLEPAFLVGYRQTPSAMSTNVRRMRRSYHRIMDEARRSHPELPAKLFRWSRAAFDFYTAEILQAEGSHALGATYLARAMIADPTWLMRPSTAKKFRRWLRHRLRGAKTSNAAAAMLHDFESLCPDAVWDVPEGNRITSRRAWLGTLQISSRQS